MFSKFQNGKGTERKPCAYVYCMDPHCSCHHALRGKHVYTSMFICSQREKVFIFSSVNKKRFVSKYFSEKIEREAGTHVLLQSKRKSIDLGLWVLGQDTDTDSKTIVV
jgi:hypothetical protein